MEGTGGVRKLRWGRGAQGKSDGFRVTYYFHDESMPLYLLTLFAKNQRANFIKDWLACWQNGGTKTKAGKCKP